MMPASSPSNRMMGSRTAVLTLPTVIKQRVVPVVSVKFRLVVMYLQVLSMLYNMLDSDAAASSPASSFSLMPENYAAFLMNTQWVNLDLTPISTYSCLIEGDYFWNLLLYTTTPLLMVLLVAAGTALLCLRYRGEPEVVETASNRACTFCLALSFLVLAGESTKLFAYFTCTPLEDGHRYLQSDLRIRCDSATYRRFVPWVVVGIGLYPIGITATYAALLVRYRQRIELPGRPVAVALRRRQQDPSIRMISFLWGPYEPRAWWYVPLTCLPACRPLGGACLTSLPPSCLVLARRRCRFEIAECVRRLSLTCFLAVYRPGEAQQLVAAVLLSVGGILLYDSVLPYSDDMDQLLGKVVIR